MNLAHLRTFVAVVRCQSISRAATELHLTQPAVTKHLQALEQHYGRTLVERVGRDVHLTEEGDILYRHALEVLRILAEAETDLAEAGKTVRGALRLGASTTPGQYVLPYIIGAFLQAYPQVDLQLEIADTAQIARKVAGGQADVGVVGSPVKDRQLVASPVLEDQLVVIMPRGHSLAARERVFGRDLVGQPLVWRQAGSGTRKTVEERLARAGIDLGAGHKAPEMGSTEAVVVAVEAGLGLSVVSRFAVQKSVQLGTLVAKSLADVSLKRALYVIRPRHGVSRAASAFLEFLQGAEARKALNRLLGPKETEEDAPAPAESGGVGDLAREGELHERRKGLDRPGE